MTYLVSPEKRAARTAVRAAVSNGSIPPANALPCVDCGHIFDGGTRHEYDHHRGYLPSFFLVVEAVCSLCHARRERLRRETALPARQRRTPPTSKQPNAQKTHCLRGHPFDEDNTSIRRGGSTAGFRRCRACNRERMAAKRLNAGSTT